MKVINVTRARKEKISAASLLAVAAWNTEGHRQTGELRYLEQAEALMQVVGKLMAKKSKANVDFAANLKDVFLKVGLKSSTNDAVEVVASGKIGVECLDRNLFPI